ncbi:MAG: phosphoribosylformylglycinamidine cyclo-ligase [Acidimicrobiia bacterium]|nr:phosphoribosylformylglycinamidine cyclo-ligase [Acidimicrobiia bacterium]MDH5504259.1 phosphoribosylformylglycinamidine cyclo-ligase [Acidimicrobiia bacterium]
MDPYKAAGVDVAAADEYVGTIADAVTASWGTNVVGGFGGFAAGLTIPSGYTNPILMMSTDGVGTKLEIARLMGDYSTVGTDLVAMCVDDLAAVGARAIGFTDYLAVGKLDPSRERTIVESIASACAGIGCALLGGETAEHPGVVASNHVDLAGAALGIVEAGKQITGEAIQPGDQIIGIASPNVRSNGFSLIRKIVDDLDELFPGSDRSIGSVLLEPSIIYTPAALALADAGLAVGFAHVTGGGLPGNAGRPLPNGLSARIDTGNWPRPPIFDWLAERGRIALEAMYGAFNMGIGFLIFARPEVADRVFETVSAFDLQAYGIGTIEENSELVQLL